MTAADPPTPADVRDATGAFDARSASALTDRVAGARVVLIGEASHGTSEFYTERAALTRTLIAEHGFSFVAVEGDWPPCAELNQFVHGGGPGHQPHRVATALAAFERWPRWMWANWEVAAFASWLREHNREFAEGTRASFYGLDVYSLHESLEAVVRWLTEHRPDAVDAARRAFACFEPFRSSGDEPALPLVPAGCEDEVAELLARIRADGAPAHDGAARFDAEQNALVTQNAERYYRAALRGGGASWNVRDRHMQETLERLLDVHGTNAKGIVWAHNTHVGDARHTDMGAAGLVNLGQLARERWGRENVALIGFGSHRGTVLAGRSWGAEQETMDVPPAPPESWEDLFHHAGRPSALLMSDDVRDRPEFARPRNHRAIGVVYRPERERYGNWVPTSLTERYDAFIYLDETHALHPIYGAGARERPPETYPWGF